MAQPGRYHLLTVIDEQPHGLYLDDAEGGKILLPRKQIPADTAIGDSLKVFVYFDSDDRPIATTLRPKAQVGQVAYLTVVDVNSTGAFMDWGLPKDLFVPFSEQKQRMEAERAYPVYIYEDNTGRISATARLNRFIKDEAKPNWPGAPEPFTTGDQVSLIITNRTELGYKAVINNEFWGVLYNDDIRKPVKIGLKLDGYIKRIREDSRIDLMLEPAGHGKADPLARKILKKLEEGNGSLGLGDHSPADLIELHFGVSKRTFKMAIGKLFKERKIVIETDGIRLATADDQKTARPARQPDQRKDNKRKADDKKAAGKKGADKGTDKPVKSDAPKARKVIRNPKKKTENTLSLKKKS